MKCKCGKDTPVLFEGGLCKTCFDSQPKKELVVSKEKRSFSITVNQKRKKERIRKAIMAGKASLKICEFCTKEFYTTKRNQRFCDVECRENACNERYKERKIK